MRTDMPPHRLETREQEQIKLVNDILKRMELYLTMQIPEKTEEEKKEIKKNLKNVRNLLEKMKNKPHENMIVITTLLTKEERYVSGLLGLKTINNVFPVDKISKQGVNESLENLIENLNIPLFLSDNKQPTTPQKLRTKLIGRVSKVFRKKPTTD